MYGASLTKAVFGYLVTQLASERKLDLDRPIAAMLPKPLPEYGNLQAYGNWGDLAEDARWRRITPRHALNHATGFANFSALEPDGKLRVQFDPGTRYAHSGEGISLLQLIAFSEPQGRGWMKGGHNDVTANTLVCLHRGRRCVLILGNDVRIEKAFPALVRAALGNTGVPYDWEYGFPPDE